MPLLASIPISSSDPLVLEAAPLLPIFVNFQNVMIFVGIFEVKLP